MSKEIYDRFKRNAAIILGSRVIFGVLNIVTSMIFVRMFGLGDLGIVVLLHSYTRLFNDVIKFDSWQAVVTYGAALQEHKNDNGLRRLLGLMLSIDLTSMAIGVVCAIIFAPYAAEIFEWPDKVTQFAPIYVITIFFIAHATPNGILRLFDRVDALAAEFAIKAVVRFVGVLLTAYFDGNVFHLVLVWFSGSVIAGSWPMIICGIELYKRKLVPIFSLNWRKAGREFKGIWRFLAFANASTTTGFLYTSGSTLFLGSFLGASPAAAFEIALQFVDALSRPARILGPIIAPEFAKLVAKGDWITFRKIISRQLKVTGLMLVAASVILFALLNVILETIYGKEILQYIWLFRFLVVFVLLKVLSFTFDPAILAANKPGTLLIIRVVVALFYCGIGLSFIQSYGLAAAGFAMMLSQVIYLAIFGFFGRKLLAKRVKKMRTAD